MSPIYTFLNWNRTVYIRATSGKFCTMKVLLSVKKNYDKAMKGTGGNRR